MELFSNELMPDTVKLLGKQASATVKGIRRNGFLVGNRFVYGDSGGVLWMQCGPGEFKSVKIWRK